MHRVLPDHLALYATPLSLARSLVLRSKIFQDSTRIVVKRGEGIKVHNDVTSVLNSVQFYVSCALNTINTNVTLKTNHCLALHLSIQVRPSNWVAIKHLQNHQDVARCVPYRGRR